jgi:hypothetical protein
MVMLGPCSVLLLWVKEGFVLEAEGAGGGGAGGGGAGGGGAGDAGDAAGHRARIAIATRRADMLAKRSSLSSKNGTLILSYPEGL